MLDPQLLDNTTVHPGPVQIEISTLHSTLAVRMHKWRWLWVRQTNTCLAGRVLDHAPLTILIFTNSNQQRSWPGASTPHEQISSSGIQISNETVDSRSALACRMSAVALGVARVARVRGRRLQAPVVPMTQRTLLKSRVPSKQTACVFSCVLQSYVKSTEDVMRKRVLVF